MSADQLPSPLDRLHVKDQLRRTLYSGETLFLQNSAAGGLYYLVSGVIELRRTTNSGHSVKIHRAQSGETFAEASLFSDTYHCTATAKSDAQVIECRRAAIEDLLKIDIEFARNMAARFAVQIQSNRRRLELLSIRAADERILVGISDGLLQEDIASFADTIGLAPETVYRTLAQLSRDKKVVKTARGQYQLKVESLF